MLNEGKQLYVGLRGVVVKKENGDYNWENSERERETDRERRKHTKQPLSIRGEKKKKGWQRSRNVPA